MEQTEKKRDFKVLAEKISPENILIMSELLAIKETKTLIRFMSRHAVIAHAKLCKDVFCKDTRGYVLSDCYDIVQSVAVFLCEHFGEYRKSDRKRYHHRFYQRQVSGSARRGELPGYRD